MELILLIPTLLYCCAVLLVLLKITPKQKYTEKKSQPFISIVIAARNEESRIKPTLESLSRINYTKEKYEIIFVDDASTDKTAALIEEFVKSCPNGKLIRIIEKNSKLRGKKAALKSAIAKAQGEIILTTDADCIVPVDWLKAMVDVFDDDTVMVLGHALLVNQKGWLNILLRFDNLFSGILMAATTLLGFPLSSVGRNMAYRKEAYVKSGGYDELSSHKSGDDVHLTELFRRTIKGKIVFNLIKKSFILSKPPDRYKEIFHQQIRKNSKIFKKSFPSVALSLFLFFYHVMLIVFPFLFSSLIQFWFLLLALKLFCEFVTLTIAAKIFSDTSLLAIIPFMQILYPFYVSIMGIAGLFQKYEWKK